MKGSSGAGGRGACGPGAARGRSPPAPRWAGAAAARAPGKGSPLYARPACAPAAQTYRRRERGAPGARPHRVAPGTGGRAPGSERWLGLAPSRRHGGQGGFDSRDASSAALPGFTAHSPPPAPFPRARVLRVWSGEVPAGSHVTRAVSEPSAPPPGTKPGPPSALLRGGSCHLGSSAQIPCLHLKTRFAFTEFFDIRISRASLGREAVVAEEANPPLPFCQPLGSRSQTRRSPQTELPAPAPILRIARFQCREVSVTAPDPVPTRGAVWAPCQFQLQASQDSNCPWICSSFSVFLEVIHLKFFLSP